MKILISSDIEGASGLATFREIGYPLSSTVDPQSTPDYMHARQLLTDDINAAVEGAIDAGADSFVLHDSHGLNYQNVIIDKLNPKVQLIQGMPIIFFEYEDLNESFDAAFLIAMHDRAGQPGILSHVLSWPTIKEVRINGKPVGESQITAALAGYFDIPTILVTGDDNTCKEMLEFTSNKIEVAIVKESLTRYAVRCLPLAIARKKIKEAAFKAIKKAKSIKPFNFKSPTKLEVDFLDRQVAWYVSWMPNTSYDGNITVTYSDSDFLNVYKTLLAMFWIATSKLNPF